MEDMAECSECGKESFLESGLCRRCRKGINTPFGLVRNNVMSNRMLAFLWLSISRERSGAFVGDTREGRKNVMNQSVRFAPPKTEICTIETNATLGFQRNEWSPHYPNKNEFSEKVTDLVDNIPGFLVVGDIPDKEGIQYSILMSLIFNSCTLYASMDCDRIQQPDKAMADKGVSGAMMSEMEFICKVCSCKNNVGYRVSEIYGVRCLEDNCEKVKIFEWSDGFTGINHLDYIEQQYGKEERDNFKDLLSVLELSVEKNSGVQEFSNFLEQCTDERIF